jgi:hypothetical protein
MLSDRRKGVPEMAEDVRVSVGLCFIILTRNFRLRRLVSAQFIQRLLMFEEKEPTDCAYAPTFCNQPKWTQTS